MKTKEQKAAYNKKWREGRPEAWKENKRAIARANFEKRQASSYGFTLEEWQVKKDKQPNCAICNVKFSTEVAYKRQKKHNTRHSDHEHRSGHFRAFVCSPCNLLLGNARESVLILRKAIAYLKKFRRTVL